MTADQKVSVYTVSALLLASIGVKLAYIEKFALWVDEAYVVWFTGLSYRDIFFWGPTFECHPPLYHALVKFWGSIANAVYPFSREFAFRSFSVLLGVLLVPVGLSTLVMLRRVMDFRLREASIVLVAVLSFSPVLTWYSLEVRPYLLFSLSYSLAIYGLVSVAVQGGAAGLREWIGLAAGIVLTNWSHSVGPVYGFLLVLLLALIWRCRHTNDGMFGRKLLATIAAVALFSLPLIYIVLHQLIHWSSGNWLAEPTVGQVIATFYRMHCLVLLNPYLKAFLPGGIPVTAVRVALVSVPLWVVLFGYAMFLRNRRYDQALFFGVLTFVPTFITYGISVIGPNVYLARTLIPGLVPFYLVLAVSIGRIGSPVLKNMVLVYISLAVASCGYIRLETGSTEPWDEIAAYLRNRSGRGDIILLVPNTIELPLRLYDADGRIAARIQSLPAAYPALGDHLFRPLGTPAVPGVVSGDAAYIDSITRDNRNVFLLTRNEPLFDPDAVVRNTLQKRFQGGLVRVFNDNIKLYAYTGKTKT